MRSNYGSDLRQRLIIILLACFSAPLMLGQGGAPNPDLRITAVGPIRDLARNVFWNASGSQGIDNNFIFTPTYATEGVCFSFTNNDTVHSYSAMFNVYSNQDQTAIGYAANPGAWLPVGPTLGFPGPMSGVPSGQVAILAAGQTKNYFVQVAGASRVAVVISNTATANNGTATLVIVESPNASGCGNLTALPVTCPYSETTTLAAGNTEQLTFASPGQAVYVCDLSVSSQGGASGLNNALVLSSATSVANCISLSSINRFVLASPTGGLTLAHFAGSPLIGRFNGIFDSEGIDFAGYLLCATNNTSVSLVLNLSYAQF
jgi:hypothetical protein